MDQRNSALEGGRGGSLDPRPIFHLHIIRSIVIPLQISNFLLQISDFFIHAFHVFDGALLQIGDPCTHCVESCGTIFFDLVNFVAVRQKCLAGLLVELLLELQNLSVGVLLARVGNVLGADLNDPFNRSHDFHPITRILVAEGNAHFFQAANNFFSHGSSHVFMIGFHHLNNLPFELLICGHVCPHGIRKLRFEPCIPVGFQVVIGP